MDEQLGQRVMDVMRVPGKDPRLRGAREKEQPPVRESTQQQLRCFSAATAEDNDKSIKE